MGDKSGIEWTDATWNPVTGCTKVSQGCKHCYAERIWKRPYPNRAFTDVQCHPDRLGQPMRWSKPRRIFVNSMSDLFHEQIPFEFIAAVFAVMGVTTRHTYQILTKRPERMLAFFRWCEEGDCGVLREPDGAFLVHAPFLDGSNPYNNLLPWKGYDNCGPVYPYENVWLGVSVENQETADERIPLLLQTPAAVRFLSCEPLLGPLMLDIYLGEYPEDEDGAPYPGRLHWAIAGGESGPKARPSHPDWFRGIRDQCLQAGVPFHFKQWGEHLPDGMAESGFVRVGKKRAGRTLDGETWDQYPE